MYVHHHTPHQCTRYLHDRDFLKTSRFPGSTSPTHQESLDLVPSASAKGVGNFTDSTKPCFKFATEEKYT